MNTYRGNLYCNLCKYETAVDCYDKAIKFNSCSVDAYKNKGKALSKLGKKAKAIECYKKVKEVDE